MDNSPEQKHGVSVSCGYLTPDPERLWKVTWILMAPQHYPSELLREFLDYLSKQLLPNFFPFAAHRELSNTSLFPLPHFLFKSSSISLLWFFFPTSVSNLLIHLHQGERERRGSGWHIFDGRYTLFPTLSSHGAPCYLHPLLPLRILTTGLPEKEIRIIQMSI